MMNCQRVNAAVQQGYEPQDPGVGSLACVHEQLREASLENVAC